MAISSHVERPVNGRGLAVIVLLLVATSINLAVTFFAFFTAPFIVFSFLLLIYTVSQIRRTVVVARIDADQKRRLARIPLIDPARPGGPGTP